MQRQTEQRLAAEALDRIHRRAIPQAESTMVVDGTRYTSPAALEAENTALFRRQPLLVALGCEVAEPGDYLTFDIAGVPVLLVRHDDGSVQGLLNTCRHRGARLLNGEGSVGKAFACPYHGWAYDRCGVLRALPGSEHFPEVDVDDTRLLRFPTREQDGLVWLLLDPAARRQPEPALGALGPELASYRLADYRNRGSRTWTKRMNWKLGVDTFLELHHVHVLHRRTIARTILNQALYEDFGRHARLVAAAPDHRGAAKRRPGDLEARAARDDHLPAIPQHRAGQPGPARGVLPLLSRPRPTRHPRSAGSRSLHRPMTNRIGTGTRHYASRSECWTTRTS